MKICCQSQHFLQLSLTLKEVLGLHHCTAFLFGSKEKSEILNVCLEKTTLGPNDTSDFWSALLVILHSKNSGSDSDPHTASAIWISDTKRLARLAFEHALIKGGKDELREYSRIRPQIKTISLSHSGPSGLDVHVLFIYIYYLNPDESGSRVSWEVVDDLRVRGRAVELLSSFQSESCHADSPFMTLIEKWEKYEMQSADSSVRF